MVPTNGKNSDAATEQPTSMVSPMRRRASAYVQNTSAAQMATMNRTRSLTARFSPSFEIPKMASGVMKGSSLLGGRSASGRRFLALQEDPAQQIAHAEEDEDHRGHHERHDADHREEAGAAVVHAWSRLQP